MSDISKKYPSVGNGTGLFLKINDGETVKVRLVSDPIIFNSEFKGNISTRFAWLIWNHDQETAQIWATNGATYNSIKDLALDEEYGDPAEYDIKITRTGVEQQTRYSVRPGTKQYKLEDEQLRACNDLDPIALIDKPDSTSHVMYLEEHREEKSVKPVAPTEDEVHEVDEEEPINLDDIPF